MENKNPILIELADISTLVAAIGHQATYTVPQGYFESFPVQLMLRIAIEEKAGADPVLNINKEHLYETPDGYFDTLAGNILNRIKAEASGDVKEELEFLSPLLGKIGKQSPFTAPEGYFADFSDNIVAGVKAVDFVNEELENLSPTMLDLKSKQVYEVPDGYFENNAAIIVEKAKQQQPAKVIKIGFGRKAMRYAAAAVVTGIIVLSGYLYSGKNAAVATDIASVTAKIPDQEIESFLNNNSVSLSDFGADADTLTTVSAADGADDTKDLLANISDEELQQYMDQRPETPISN